MGQTDGFQGLVPKEVCEAMRLSATEPMYRLEAMLMREGKGNRMHGCAGEAG